MRKRAKSGSGPMRGRTRRSKKSKPHGPEFQEQKSKSGESRFKPTNWRKLPETILRPHSETETSRLNRPSQKQKSGCEDLKGKHINWDKLPETTLRPLSGTDTSSQKKPSQE